MPPRQRSISLGLLAFAAGALVVQIVIGEGTIWAWFALVCVLLGIGQLLMQR